jgi:hypothetical protein
MLRGVKKNSAVVTAATMSPTWHKHCTGTTWSSGVCLCSHSGFRDMFLSGGGPRMRCCC